MRHTIFGSLAAIFIGGPMLAATLSACSGEQPAHITVAPLDSRSSSIVVEKQTRLVGSKDCLKRVVVYVAHRPETSFFSPGAYAYIDENGVPHQATPPPALREPAWYEGKTPAEAVTKFLAHESVGF